MTSTDTRRVPALVLGAGITLLGTLRCLGRAGIRAYTPAHADPFVRRSRWFHPLSGTFRESADPHALAKSLERVPLSRAVLIPCSDTWSLATASLGDRLQDRFPRSVSPVAVQEILTDKGRFADALRNARVPHPRTTAIASKEALEALPEESFRDSFLKPRTSQAFSMRYGVKALRCRGREDAIARYEGVRRDGLEMVLQEYIPGPPTAHVFVDGFVDRTGTPRVRFARRRIRMFPLDFGNSTCLVSIPLSDVAPAVEALDRLLAALRYRGVFSAEFKYDERDGLYKILEVNARPWWYVEFAADCGVNVCEFAYRDALGLPVPTVDRYATGVTCVYPQYDWVSCLRMHREGTLTLGAWARSWAFGTQPIFRWADPGPGMRHFASVFPRAIRRVFGRVVPERAPRKPPHTVPQRPAA